MLSPFVPLAKSQKPLAVVISSTYNIDKHCFFIHNLFFITYKRIYVRVYDIKSVNGLRYRTIT